MCFFGPSSSCGLLANASEVLLPGKLFWGLKSSKMTQSERAATFWTPVALLIAGVLGAVALPALKPMLPANIAAMLP